MDVFFYDYFLKFCKCGSEMKIIQNSLYEMWCNLTDRLLEMKGLGEAEFKEEGKLAWKIIMHCSEHNKLSDDADVAFWTAWGNCNVTYPELAEMFNSIPEIWKRKKNKVTINNIKG
jgi:hypothetical protein